MSQLTRYNLNSKSTVSALGCYYTTVYFLSTERKAYQRTWSCRYVWGEANWSSLDSAKECAETHRKQGTKFVIEEIPAIAFPYMKGEKSLVVTEMRSPNPLSGFKNLQLSTSRISEIARFFKPDLGSTASCLSGKSSARPEKELLVYISSKSKGRGYPLSWCPNSDNPSPINKNSCIRLASKLNTLLKELK